jgi:hypothetical protein
MSKQQALIIKVPEMLHITINNLFFAHTHIRSTRGLGPTMTTRGQSIGISIGLPPQTLVMSRLDQLLQLDAQV